MNEYNRGWQDGLTAIQDIITTLKVGIILKNTPNWYQYHEDSLNKVMDNINSLLQENQNQEIEEN